MHDTEVRGAYGGLLVEGGDDGCPSYAYDRRNWTIPNALTI